MVLLSSGITQGQLVTVIVLCVAVILFVIFDTVLVISLHKRDKRLERRKRMLASIKEKVFAEKAKKSQATQNVPSDQLSDQLSDQQAEQQSEQTVLADKENIGQI